MDRSSVYVVTVLCNKTNLTFCAWKKVFPNLHIIIHDNDYTPSQQWHHFTANNAKVFLYTYGFHLSNNPLIKYLCIKILLIDDCLSGSHVGEF